MLYLLLHSCSIVSSGSKNCKLYLPDRANRASRTYTYYKLYYVHKLLHYYYVCPTIYYYCCSCCLIVSHSRFQIQQHTTYKVFSHFCAQGTRKLGWIPDNFFQRNQTHPVQIQLSYVWMCLPNLTIYILAVYLSYGGGFLKYRVFVSFLLGLVISMMMGSQISQDFFFFYYTYKYTRKLFLENTEKNIGLGQELRKNLAKPKFLLEGNKKK